MIFKEVILIFVLVIIFSKSGYAALGVSPAIVKLNFIPGQEYVIDYNVFSDNPNKEISLSVGGELAEYVKLSKNKLIGGGGFTATLMLPDKIDRPGENEIGIITKEKLSEANGIGTAIQINVVIKIFVPYPGRYLEATLDVKDGNIDEEIPVDIKFVNRGLESLYVSSYVSFLSSNKDKIFTMAFDSIFINSTEEKYITKLLNTTGYRPGDYFAEAFINYGDEMKANDSFRIGSLYINITNFSKELFEGSIQKFLINIESKWNGDLKEVYADVNISNSTKSFIFRTPNADLPAWSRGILEGFLDTEGMRGEYKTEISLKYSSEKSYASGTLVVLRRGINSLIYVSGIIALLAVVIILFMIWKKKKNSFFRRSK